MVQWTEGLRFYRSRRWQRRFICPSLGNLTGRRSTSQWRAEGRVRDWERRKGPSLCGQSTALLKLNIMSWKARTPFFDHIKVIWKLGHTLQEVGAVGLSLAKRTCTQGLGRRKVLITLICWLSDKMSGQREHLRGFLVDRREDIIFHYRNSKCKWFGFCRVRGCQVG